MNSLVLILLSILGYILAYRFYGRFLGRKIFQLSPDNTLPSHEFQDNVDYIPTKKHIIFGHHFTTIAGLGPIVGPAIGIIWGWFPAFIWVFIGSIFMGAVHDFSTLIISARNQGKTIGELTGIYISPSTRFAFQFLMQLLLFVVLAVFAMIVGVLFNMYPEVVIPVWFQVPIAVWLGWQIRKGSNEWLYSIIAVILLYASIVLGIYFPVELPAINGSPVVTWTLILFVYVFFASTIPVHKLLQPRDYINSHQLLIAIVLLVTGIVVARPVITAPAFNPAVHYPDNDIPNLMPLLFITIACGAVSGFHSLASSGTTVKQVDNEKDTLFVGYGSMIWESFLAVIVLVAVAGGLGMGIEHNGIMYKGTDAFAHHYSSWSAASGLSAKLQAFITGGANLIESFGIPKIFAKSLIAVFIVSFANTTLDSAARIQRLSLQEIFKTRDGRIRKPIGNRYLATLMIVMAAAALAFAKPGAAGAMILWPLFGSLNQLLAALALGIVSIYLHRKNKNILIAFIPMLFVLFMTIYTIFLNIREFWEDNERLLFILSLLILGLTLWLLVSGVHSLFRRPNKKPT